MGGWNFGSIGGSDGFQQFFSFLVARIFFFHFFIE